MLLGLGPGHKVLPEPGHTVLSESGHSVTNLTNGVKEVDQKYLDLLLIPLSGYFFSRAASGSDIRFHLDIERLSH